VREQDRPWTKHWSFGEKAEPEFFVRDTDVQDDVVHLLS
jgi:hypothetical protein